MRLAPFIPDVHDPNYAHWYAAHESNLRASFEGKPHEPPRGWVVEGLLPQGYLALLAGKPKSAKTNLAVTLAAAVAQGLPFAGSPTTKGPVLYFAVDESREEWDLAVYPHLPKNVEGLHIAHASGFRLDFPADLYGLKSWIYRENVALVVIDPLLAALDRPDLSRSNSARSALSELKRLCTDLGVSAAVVHHAKERRGLARHTADNAQLSAIASLELVLNARPHLGGRLITLNRQGRGLFANQTLQLFSRGPCEYMGHPLSSPRQETSSEPEASSGDERGAGGEHKTFFSQPPSRKT